MVSRGTGNDDSAAWIGDGRLSYIDFIVPGDWEAGGMKIRLRICPAGTENIRLLRNGEELLYDAVVLQNDKHE